ncbi:tripartite tricarboxylate transporter TctB family protein [Macromonas nakdongensis]|uniref:tripartite tricarboxylate transporter TctB family protein n=1 Tax=Macromonas nakdongensis TaxID=1843082 RepID=UPI000C323199|nr:tripartite tricarboxylate transporter TctB family protein [Macromonas nakdongensis]
MAQADTRDLIGGLAMVAIGLFAAVYAHRHYPLGELQRMGPGFFPVVLGALLALLGLLIALPALLRRRAPLRIEWKTGLLVTGSVAVFGLLLPSLGLVLTTVASVLVALLAERAMPWPRRLAVALGIAAFTWLVFGLALKMVLPAWPWSP